MLSGFPLKWRREWPLDLYKAVLGLFLLASPWLFSFAYQGTRVEAWAVGLALLAVSVAALIAFVDVEEWLALALGLWLVAAPWLLGFKSPASRIHIAVGLIVAYLAALQLWLVHYDTPNLGREKH